MIDAIRFRNPDGTELVLGPFAAARLAGDTLYATGEVERRTDGRERGTTALVGPDAGGGYHLVPVETPVEMALAVRDAAGRWAVNGFDLDGATYADVLFLTNDYLDALVPSARPLPT